MVREIRTCGFPVVLEDLTQDQLVGVQGEGVPEHLDREQVHVAVGPLRLVRAGPVKVPLGNICSAGKKHAFKETRERHLTYAPITIKPAHK